MHIGPRVVNKEKFLRALKGARKPEDLLKRIGFATRRGADKHGKQVDWLVLDVVTARKSISRRVRPAVDRRSMSARWHGGAGLSPLDLP